MTTNIQLGMSAARGAVGGSTSNLEKQWKKNDLVNMVLGLSFFVRSLPQGADLFRHATRLITASPAQGGGFDNARTALGGAFSVNDDALIWSTSQGAASNSEKELESTDPADEHGGSDWAGGSGVSDGTSVNALGAPSPVGSPSAKPRQKACRTAYDGFTCQDSNCSRWHPSVYCHKSSCYPKRQAECTDWHPRKWSFAAQGNGSRGGTGRPSLKASKSGSNSNKNKDKNSTKKNSFSVVKRLESELSKTRAELSSQRVVGKTFRDALLASRVPPPQHQLHTTNTYTKSTPATTASVPVLPSELMTLLSTLAKALAAAGIPSQ